MNAHPFIIRAALSVFTVTQAPAPQPAAEWAPELQMKVRTVGTPRVSPDGRRVVYTVTEAVMTADKSENLTQIHLASTDGRESIQLTFADKSSTNPKWSPDGNWLAFTSTRKDSKSNLYVMRAGGGEPDALTDVKTGVGDFDWSPDGRSIAYTMTDPKSEEEEKDDKARNDFRWLDENVKMARLYVVPVQKDAAGKREPRKLTTENYTVNGFDWSPDGSRIVFTHQRTPVANDWPTSDVSIVDVNTARATPFATTPAEESAALYSPDGKWIAIGVSDDPPRWATRVRIHVFPAAGGAAKALAATYDAQPTIAGWSADGRRLYFSEARGSGTQLYELDVNGNSIEAIKTTPAVYGAISLNRTGTMFAFTRQMADAPPEAFVASATSFTPIQVSRANTGLKLPPLGKTEVVQWNAPDGKPIEGLLTYPVGYRPGQRVPLILNVHGGPTGVFQQTFIGGRGVYPLATFAAHGFAILRPNPRGSSGYGPEFRFANVKDWGGGDYQDLMSGVDKVIAMGVADPDRLGVMGWSYGGFMTSWIVTHTKRFKAASAGAPVTNLQSFTGTADIPAFIPDYFGAQWWDATELYLKHSPVFNVKGVSTPTMIQHGEADVRVPISQGYEFYHALKAQGVPTRMLVLPRQPHGPTEPRMQLIAMRANLEWFEKYLRKSTGSDQ